MRQVVQQARHNGKRNGRKPRPNVVVPIEIGLKVTVKPGETVQAALKRLRKRGRVENFEAVRHLAKRRGIRR